MNDEWQDIKTAPKDGTIILVACTKAAFDFNGEGVIEGGVAKVEWKDSMLEEDEGCWSCTDTCYYSVDILDATHWMLLPEPPKGEEN